MLLILVAESERSTSDRDRIGLGLGLGFGLGFVFGFIANTPKGGTPNADWETGNWGELDTVLPEAMLEKALEFRLLQLLL